LPSLPDPSWLYPLLVFGDQRILRFLASLLETTSKFIIVISRVAFFSSSSSQHGNGVLDAAFFLNRPRAPRCNATALHLTYTRARKLCIIKFFHFAFSKGTARVFRRGSSDLVTLYLVIPKRWFIPNPPLPILPEAGPRVFLSPSTFTSLEVARYEILTTH